MPRRYRAGRHTGSCIAIDPAAAVNNRKVLALSSAFAVLTIERLQTVDLRPPWKDTSNDNYGILISIVQSYGTCGTMRLYFRQRSKKLSNKALRENGRVFEDPQAKLIPLMPQMLY